MYNRHVYRYNKKKNAKIEHTSLMKFENNAYFLITPGMYIVLLSTEIKKKNGIYK